jgi:hypothetical protein
LGKCYLVFTRRIQPAHIVVTSRTLKRELQGKFRDIKSTPGFFEKNSDVFAREEYRQKRLLAV